MGSSTHAEAIKLFRKCVAAPGFGGFFVVVFWVFFLTPRSETVQPLSNHPRLSWRDFGECLTL